MLQSLRFHTLIHALLAISVPGLRADDQIDFNRDIRPILSDKCFQCHGPDEAERRGGTEGLRLDTEAGAFEDLGGYTVIVRGKPEESELIRRIESQVAGEMMPPSGTGKSLSAREVDLLRKWVQEGAKYATHWSYVKPRRPEIPEVKNADWVRNEIDPFILARLQKEGLKPAPEADRYTLIRRLSLDLTGLPPTPDEVKAFVGDKRSNAYELLVDRLLAKKSYGEHWARMWLDLARYADSAGYADDPPRTIWAYRDYVIRSLNANKPFDQFTIEQIAGDLLPDPTNDQLIATAFHRNTLTNNEGGTNDEEFRNVAVVDRVNTTLAVWMGTTMACAQCHSHKYDPITQEEYFQVFALFNNTEDADKRNESPLLQIYTKQQRQQEAAWQTDIADLEKRVQTFTPELRTAQTKWESRLSEPLVWKKAKVQSVQPHAGQREIHLANLGQSSVTAIKLRPRLRDNAETTKPFSVTRIVANVVPRGKAATSARFVRVEIPGKRRILSLAEVQVFANGKNIAPRGKAAQSSTDYDGPAKLAVDGNTDGHYFNAKSTTHTKQSDNPWWQLDLETVQPVERIVVWNRTDGTVGSRLKDFRVSLLDADQKPVWQTIVSEPPNPEVELAPDGIQSVPFSSAIARPVQKGFHPADLIANGDKKNGTAWNINTKSASELILLASSGVHSEADAELVLTMEMKGEDATTADELFDVFLATDSRASQLAAIPSEILDVLQTPKDKRTPSGQAALDDYFLSVTKALEPERKKLASLKKQLAEQKPATTVPIMRELPEDKRRVTKIQQRGNYLITGKEVHAGVPEIFHSLPRDLPPNRLALAHWLIDEDNPLTARVIANRYWEKIFGIGLVETSEEFGSQGEPPSHPRLLDWLATELVRLDWDLKKFVKLLVMSAAYRQSAAVTEELYNRDPDNRLLARGPRFRMSAEMIRDQALFVSGLLSEKMFGPPVKPPQPKLGVSAAFGSGIDWTTSEGDDKYRRGLYTMWRRSNPYPSMATFDAPNREVCTLRRDRTNTPLQALVTLNDPVYVEAAQALGRRIAGHEGDLNEKLTIAILLCLSRTPAREEIERLESLYARAMKRYESHPNLARKMATDPIGELPKGASAAEYASWAVVGNVLLNLDEMFMRR